MRAGGKPHVCLKTVVRLTEPLLMCVPDFQTPIFHTLLFTELWGTQCQGISLTNPTDIIGTVLMTR